MSRPRYPHQQLQHLPGIGDAAADGCGGTSETRYVVNNVVEVRVRDLEQISNVIQAALDAARTTSMG